MYTFDHRLKSRKGIDVDNLKKITSGIGSHTVVCQRNQLTVISVEVRRELFGQSEIVTYVTNSGNSQIKGINEKSDQSD